MTHFERLKRLAAPALRALAARGGWVRQRALSGRRPELEARAPAVREVSALAWPIAAAMLGETAMGLVDTRLVGALGPASIGGVGVATVLMYLCYAVVMGLMRGVKVRVAWAAGEGRPGDALRFAEVGALIGVAAGAVVWLLARDATWALRALRVDPALVRPAGEFLAARSWGAVGLCVMSALTQWRQGLGDTRTSMRVGLAGNVVNATLAYALIHGRFGAPRLGVAGAGYATAVTESLQCAVLVWMFLRERRGVRRSTAASMRDALREVGAVGVPTGAQFGAEMLAFTTFTALLGSLGADEIAAHQVALATIRASFLPGIAVAEAASVLVGRALGRGSIREADRVVVASLQLAGLFMTLCGLAFALFGEAIVRVFTDDAAVVALARQLLLVAAVFQLLDAFNIVLRAALRGARDARAVALLGVLVVWTCIPGAAWLLGREMGMGALGGWIGFVGETLLGTLAFGWRWCFGAWRRPYDKRSHGSATSMKLVAA